MYFIYIQEKIFNFFKAIFVVNSAFNRLHKYNKWHVTCFNLQPVAVSVKKKRKIEINLIYYSYLYHRL